MSKPNFGEEFIAVASDGKHRTVKQIRELMGLPDTSNVGESLANLQAKLVGTEWKLRRTVLRSHSHYQLWWLERRKGVDPLPLSEGCNESCNNVTP